MSANTPKKLVAYGDCNTLGFRECEGRAWPEIVAKSLGAEVKNLGNTMSTTREMSEFVRDFPPAGYDVAFIQYGLVDSWLTFRHSPYVLYYPTNPARKLWRKIVKKIKKWARILRVHDVLGWQNVVPKDEYLARIERTIAANPRTQFMLVATAPNHDRPRNPRIEEYNAGLAALAARFPNAHYIDVYGEILAGLDHLYYPDGTHLNDEGQQLVARRVLEGIRRAGIAA